MGHVRDLCRIDSTSFHLSCLRAQSSFESSPSPSFFDLHQDISQRGVQQVIILVLSSIRSVGGLSDLLYAFLYHLEIQIHLKTSFCWIQVSTIFQSFCYCRGFFSASKNLSPLLNNLYMYIYIGFVRLWFWELIFWSEKWVLLVSDWFWEFKVAFK